MSEPTTRKASGRRVTVRCPFCSRLNRVDLARTADRPRCGKCARPLLLDRPVDVTDQDFERFLRDAEVPVLVDFHADWCGPCKMMAPVMDSLAHDNQGELLVARLDSDRNSATSARFNVRGIPTFILFRGAREVGRETGAVPRSRLDALLGNETS